MLDAISSGRYHFVLYLHYVLDLLKRYQDDLLFYTGQHLILVAVSMLMALAVGIVAGVILSRPALQRYGEIGMQVFNLSNAIPPMSVLMIALILFGIGDVPTIIALWLASLLPIARNTYQGILNVNPAMREAARGIGLTPWQQLWHVELPNAIPTIMGGVRTALAINVGSAPLAYLIGANSLGSLIFPGIYLHDPAKMIIGSVATALLALVLDGLVALLARWMSPRGVITRQQAIG